MAISNLKLASAILGVGGVATGASVGLYSYLNNSKGTNLQKDSLQDETVNTKESKPKAIFDWLNEDGFELLKKPGNDEDWNQNWVKFVEANTGDDLSEPWNFADYKSKKANKESVPEEFKAVCEKNSKVKIKEKEGSEYEKVKNYCSKAKTKDAS